MTLHARLARKVFIIPAAVVGATGLLTGGTALAAAAPGDNGDVKIHRSTTSATDQRNEPKVCAFYLVGFNFDGGQDLRYDIVSGPPFKSASALSGDIDINGDGFGRTGNLRLPDGMYKLNVTFADENGRAKSKVFKVDCPAAVALPDPDPDPDPDTDLDPDTNPDTDLDPDQGPDSEPGPGVDSADKPSERDLADEAQVQDDEDDGIQPVGGVSTGGGAMATGLRR